MCKDPGCMCYDEDEAIEAPRLVAIYDGGDWSDAGVTHVMIPSDLDLDAALKAWRHWLAQEYPQGAKFMPFTQFLVARCGAEDAGLEEFWV